MAQRKKHLKYRARKLDSHSAGTPATELGSIQSDNSVVSTQTVTHDETRATKKIRATDRLVSAEPKIYSALSAEATSTLQRELRHLLVVACVIAFIYLVLWIVFARLGVEDRIIQSLNL